MRKFKFDRGFVATTSPDPVHRLEDMYVALFVRVESVARSICAPTKFEKLIKKAKADECSNLEWRKIGRIHDQVLDEMADRAPVGYEWTQWQKDEVIFYGYRPLPDESSPPIMIDRRGREVTVHLPTPPDMSDPLAYLLAQRDRMPTRQRNLVAHLLTSREQREMIAEVA